MVARRNAPRNLQVDEALAHAVAAGRLLQHHLQRGAAHGRGDLQFREAALEALEVARGVSKPPAENGPDLVDAVGELVAAILDVDTGLAVRNETAVDVGDAAHQASTASSALAPPKPRDLSLRWRADRSMPMKAAVREIFPPKRMI